MRFWEATGEQSPAEAFIKQIYSEYPVSPFNPNQHAILTGEGENQTIALFELEPSKSVRGAVELHWIQAYPQRQGVGSAAIRELQDKARAAGIKMSLYPKPNGAVSQASLKRLYKRLGFTPIHKGAATMVWDPAVSEQVASKFSEYEIAIMEGGGDVTSAKQVTVYHGNQGGIHREFVTPMWWTESYEDAAYYATLNDMDGFVYKATLSCNNPYVISKQDANAAVQNWRKLAIKGYDCIHDSDTGDWIPFYSKDINLIGYDSLDPSLEEDWRHVVTGLGAASMIAGGGSAAYDAYKSQQQTQQPQAHVQQVQTPQAKVQAPQAKPQPQMSQAQAVSHAQDLLATKGAQILQKAAKAAGLKGTELAQFMAQCAHETANFTTLKELGDRNYFKKYDIKFNPAKAKELGNTRPGDGELYKGRGFIQLTGKYNYQKAGEALGLPLVQKPQLLERPDVAAKAALWFWKNRVQPNVSNFQDTQQATRPINPGLKGLSDRHNKYVGMKVATAKPAPTKAAPVKVATTKQPGKGKKV